MFLGRKGSLGATSYAALALAPRGGSAPNAPTAPARVLVTDGRQRSTLAVVRALGRAGHAPYVVAERLPALAGQSRYAVDVGRTPEPWTRPLPFAEALAELTRRWSIDVLIPMTDAAMNAVLPHRDWFLPTEVPAPDHEAFRRVSDRSELLAVAEGLGVAVPRQRVVADPTEIDAAVADPPPFPLAVKPADAIRPAVATRPCPRVLYCADPEELRAALEAFPPEGYPVLVQQLVQGPGVGVFLLLWDGDVVASFAHRRIRERPPSGGASVLRESVPLPPDLLAQARRLLDRFAWRGVAMVEFKVDDATGTPVLMEVNGRFWGSLQLAVDAGVDFPSLLVALAQGASPTPVHEYRCGVRTRWEWGEVDHLVALLRGGSPFAVPNGESRARTVAGALRGWLSPARCEILRLSDLRPFVLETAEWIAGVLDR